MSYIYAPSTSLSPFLFRLDPTITTQLGTPRVVTGAAAPTITATTDAQNRSVLSIGAPGGNNFAFIPLLDAGSPLAVTGNFVVEMRVAPGGAGAGGFAFNGDAANPLGYAVMTRATDATGWDSYVGGGGVMSAENINVWNQLAVDASWEYVSLWMRVWLNLAGAKATYSYSSATGAEIYPTGSNAAQRRKTALVNAAGTQVGIATSRACTILSLNIWKLPQSW